MRFYSISMRKPVEIKEVSYQTLRNGAKVAVGVHNGIKHYKFVPRK